MIDKSKGIGRVVDGIKFYNGWFDPSLIAEIDGVQVVISSEEILMTRETDMDNLIRYNIAQAKRRKEALARQFKLPNKIKVCKICGKLDVYKNDKHSCDMEFYRKEND